MDSRVAKPRVLNADATAALAVTGNESSRLTQARNESESTTVHPGLVLSVSPSTPPAEEPLRYLGSLGRPANRDRDRAAAVIHSTPPTLSRNGNRLGITPGISNNSLRAAVADDTGSLSSLAMSGVELRAFASHKPSREASGFKSPEPDPQRALLESTAAITGGAIHDRKEGTSSPQRVSFDNNHLPPGLPVQAPTELYNRELPRPSRKSDSPAPGSPILRALGYLDRNKDQQSSPKAQSNSPSPSPRPRSRATSPLRIIQQWSSSLYRARSPGDEPFIPINPFTSRQQTTIKQAVPKPCRSCMSRQQQRRERGMGGSSSSTPMPDGKSFASSSDFPYGCTHIVAPLSSTLTKATQAVQLFLTDTVPREIYLNLLLRLPALYFSRVAKIFEEADLSKPDVQRMIEAGGGGGFFSLPSRSEHSHHGLGADMAGSSRRAQGSRAVSPGVASGIGLSSQIGIAPASQIVHNNQPLPCPEDWAPPLVSPALLRFKASWETFIDSLMREWKTLNLVSALLLSAICSIFQSSASADPVIRNTAFMSLICAVMSLSYGCMYIIKFGSMKSMYRAWRWAEEARKSKTSLWWNVWVFLSMPAVWMAWSMMWFIASILSFVWRTGDVTNPLQAPPISVKLALIPRVLISSVFVLGLVYFFLILRTLQRYGSLHVRGDRATRWFGADFEERRGEEREERGGHGMGSRGKGLYDVAERGEGLGPSSPGAVPPPVLAGVAEDKMERRGRERERRSSGSSRKEGVVGLGLVQMERTRSV